jgi:hypothetical protein
MYNLFSAIHNCVKFLSEMPQSVNMDDVINLDVVFFDQNLGA